MPVFLGDTPVIRRPAPPPPVDPAVTLETYYRVQQFLYLECRLLDEERYEEWLGLLTEDIHYWMPLVQARYRKDPKPRYDPHRMAYYDDDLFTLRRRITRALHPTAWAEDPPTRTVHHVSNIEVERTDNPDEYRVYSTFTCCRGRNEVEESVLHGRRVDLLRETPNGLRLARREIYITQSVLLSKNLNVFL